MPNRIFPIPQFHAPASPVSPTRPTLGLRMRTRLRRDRLDDQLASGVDPASSPELTLRAAQLQSRAVRRRLAGAIVKTLAKADGPSGGLRPAQRQHAEVRQYAENLAALVARLRDDRPIAIQGAAMIARLVNDRRSPLYRNGDLSLGSAVLSARLALDRTRTIHRDFQAAA